ncbi:chitinase-3-like protein 1 isoform X2 [Rhipicephalus sanguineus]|uniref:chitinase-3-like protein 1 isoform X2 n=1 Tax=Rhipicephalus sanguineus TaxID=34632 RepID=UPI00189520E2|nr:chitinase-3-like protein 1 isoform X2 [Rhipicephalus sanguineus]
MDVIRKAFEENSNEQNAPSKFSAAFKKFLHLRDLAADVRLLLSVDLDAMLRTGWSPRRLASDARVWLDRSGVDGLHLDGLDILPRNIRNVSEIVTALRKSFKRQYLLTVGIDRTQKIVEDELLNLLKLVDFASFSTSHIRHTDERTTLSNPYTKYENSTSGLFLSREVNHLAKLAARSPKSQVCFTLVLGGNQFQLRDSSEHGLGAPAKHVKDVSYSEICKREWSEVKYIEPAIGFYARSGKTWVGYDTEKTIAAKVQLALRKYPDFCVMLVQVDKDDVRGICSERHFPLVQSVKHAMRHYHRQAPAAES